MQQPTLDDILETTLGGDWIEEPFDFYVGDETTGDDFTGCTIAQPSGLYLNGARLLDLTTYATISLPKRLTIAVPAAVMTPLKVGAFQAGFWLQTPSAGLQPLLFFALRQKAP